MFGHTFIPLRRFPQVFPAVTSILLVQTVIFIMIFFSGHAEDTITWVQYGAFEGWRVDEGDYWRLLFSLFVHAHFLHFLFTSFSLYIFAPQLEWLFGKISFLIIFFLTGIAGNWGIYYFEVGGVHLGASASIYGFLGVYLYLYVRRVIDPQSGRGLLILTLINLFFNFQYIAAHLLSLVVGFILAALMIYIKQLKTEE